MKGEKYIYKINNCSQNVMFSYLSINMINRICWFTGNTTVRAEGERHRVSL